MLGSERTLFKDEQEKNAFFQEQYIHETFATAGLSKTIHLMSAAADISIRAHQSTDKKQTATPLNFFRSQNHTSIRNLVKIADDNDLEAKSITDATPAVSCSR